ncbi:hypothetical protein BCR33DRAFT_808584 [Rhizoclosmatium globosum]|uniref:Uncharacterized protein n=1 Tax=Rhizoclosmatium globosum TaxID=329046 RepID=A0A1Y2ANJ4_9FUNG|nr:hypothetical protein BCR33DRAFT_808584 [Rhizoclosmatium globosum]|eukprot:ORY24143.1 hypothetical protein BCR33DRAFT_808584 [Rhizoclosmatium globosum]
MFESTVPGQGITTLAPIKNFDNLLTSMGFAVEREIMLDCIHIGGLQAHPKEACQYKGVKKIIMYSGFKYQTVDHVDANHGFRSIQVAEIIENTDQFRAKIKAFVNHLTKAEEMSFGMRFEVRGEDAAVASFLQDFKNKIRTFDQKARSTLFVVEKTATLIKYIIIRIQALVSLVSLLGQLIRNHPQLKVYWEETANYIHKELICLVSKPPGWYNSNFDCYTLQKFTSQLHSFGSISYQAFPLLHILAEPNELRYTANPVLQEFWWNSVGILSKNPAGIPTGYTTEFPQKVICRNFNRAALSGFRRKLCWISARLFHRIPTEQGSFQFPVSYFGRQPHDKEMEMICIGYIINIYYKNRMKSKIRAVSELTYHTKVNWNLVTRKTNQRHQPRT